MAPGVFSDEMRGCASQTNFGQKKLSIITFFLLLAIILWVLKYLVGSQ